MAAARRPVVVSLNYHEVTQDPRVMKQARALSAAGFDVHVFCDLPEGRAGRETVDGIEVHRFAVLDPRNLADGWADRHDFLVRSGPAIHDRIGRLHAAISAARRTEGAELPDHLFRSSYLQSRGKVRLQRKATRIAALSSRWLRNLASGQGRAGVAALLSIENLRRRLFQAEAIVLSEGLMRQDLPAHVDLVHAHDLYTLPAAVLLARKLGAKLVYDAHEYEPARASKIDPAARDLPVALEDDCLPYVDAMITVSDSIADLYAARFAGPRPVILHNVPEMADFGVDIDPEKGLRARLPLAPQTETVVFTGLVLGRQRGLDKAVEALRHLPDCVLVVLGPRVQAADRWLMKTAEKHDVAARVILLPPVAAQDVPSAIAGFSLAICPIQDASISYRFAMPNKLFEAAFAGIPICVSDLPEMRRFVETMGIGVAMDQTDPVAIAAAIRSVLQDRARYMPGEEGRRLLQARYGWKTQTDKLLALYADLGYLADQRNGA